MSSAAATQCETAPSPTDDELIAQITPAMLEKLTHDSRWGAFWMGIALCFSGAFIAHVKTFGGIVDILFGFFGVAAAACGFVIIARSCLGQPSMLRTELSYRRLRGKWRWEH
jgi:hypothetical protein